MWGPKSTFLIGNKLKIAQDFQVLAKMDPLYKEFMLQPPNQEYWFSDLLHKDEIPIILDALNANIFEYFNFLSIRYDWTKQYSFAMIHISNFGIPVLVRKAVYRSETGIQERDSRHDFASYINLTSDTLSDLNKNIFTETTPCADVYDKLPETVYLSHILTQMQFARLFHSTQGYWENILSNLRKSNKSTIPLFNLKYKLHPMANYIMTYLPSVVKPSVPAGSIFLAIKFPDYSMPMDTNPGPLNEVARKIGISPPERLWCLHVIQTEKIMFIEVKPCIERSPVKVLVTRMLNYIGLQTNDLVAMQLEPFNYGHYQTIQFKKIAEVLKDLAQPEFFSSVAPVRSFTAQSTSSSTSDSTRTFPGSKRSYDEMGGLNYSMSRVNLGNTRPPNLHRNANGIPKRPQFVPFKFNPPNL